MSPFEHIAQYSRMLGNLDRWIGKAIEHAKKEKFDPEVFASARLAPDQYCFVQQVQSACDAAKYAAAYLSGQTAPSHPDNETTLADLRARIQTCLGYVGSFRAADFEGAENRRVSPPWMEGNSVRGDHYLMRFSIPNFYFHVTTAYDILRHKGVDLGKRDFIGVQDWADTMEV